MSIPGKRNVLSGLKVSAAMRRQVVRLPQEASLEQCIRQCIKFKINAVLVTDAAGSPLGVVSKTDLMGAYYADLPISTPLSSVMVGPPIFCRPDDYLESALDTMYSTRVHRLYVRPGDSEPVTGVLAYPDIVGLLYRFCRNCEMSVFQRRPERDEDQMRRAISVREVMTPSVVSHGDTQSLVEVMEGLSAYRFGAVLIRNRADLPVGVLSKSDLVLAYMRGMDPGTRAAAAMASPVQSCDVDEPLSGAIQRMIFSDVHRLFVHRRDPAQVIGVLSLTDAARARSGSCHACVSSRIRVDQTS